MILAYDINILHEAYFWLQEFLKVCFRIQKKEQRSAI